MRIVSSKNTCFGFSLAEVTITLGIVSAALLPMIAMLGGGTVLQRESEDRTKAGFISLSVMEQLSVDGNVVGVITGEGVPEIKTFAIPGGNSQLRVIAGVDLEGKVREIFPEGTYESGITSDPEIFYLIDITIQRSDSGFSVETGAREMFKTVVSIEQPAAAIAANRQSYPYVTFLALDP